MRLCCCQRHPFDRVQDCEGPPELAAVFCLPSSQARRLCSCGTVPLFSPSLMSFWSGFLNGKVICIANLGLIELFFHWQLWSKMLQFIFIKNFNSYYLKTMNQNGFRISSQKAKPPESHWIWQLTKGRLLYSQLIVHRDHPNVSKVPLIIIKASGCFIGRLAFHSRQGFTCITLGRLLFKEVCSPRGGVYAYCLLWIAYFLRVLKSLP